jgi:sulfonate transport system permease protein
MATPAVPEPFTHANQALTPPRSRSPLRRFFSNPWTIRTTSLLIVLVIWYFVGKQMPFVLSDPISIAIEATEIFVPDILPAFGETLRGLFVGLGISILVGVPVGLIMSQSHVVEVALAPYVYALSATPRITLIPVLVLWLGISFEMRVGIVFLGAVFPILLNVYLGGKQVDQGLLDLGRAFRAPLWRIYTGIRLRGSLPYVFSGLRLGLAQGLVGVVLAEVATSAGGIGNLITFYAQYFRIDAMFVAIVLLGLLAVIIATVMARFDAALKEPWNSKFLRARPYAGVRATQVGATS